MVKKRPDNKRIKIYLIQEKSILKKDLRKYQKIGITSYPKKRPIFRLKKPKERPIKPTKASLAPPEASPTGFYRYSVAYFIRAFSNDQGRLTQKDVTFRAEVVTDKQQDPQKMAVYLLKILQNKIRFKNKGVQKLFNQSRFIGVEAEPIGSNDIGLNQLNRVYCTMNDYAI